MLLMDTWSAPATSRMMEPPPSPSVGEPPILVHRWEINLHSRGMAEGRDAAADVDASVHSSTPARAQKRAHPHAPAAVAAQKRARPLSASSPVTSPVSSPGAGGSSTESSRKRYPDISGLWAVTDPATRSFLHRWRQAPSGPSFEGLQLGVGPINDALSLPGRLKAKPNAGDE